MQAPMVVILTPSERAFVEAAIAAAIMGDVDTDMSWDELDQLDAKVRPRADDGADANADRPVNFVKCLHGQAAIDFAKEEEARLAGGNKENVRHG